MVDLSEKYLYGLLSQADKKFFEEYQRDLVEYVKFFVSSYDEVLAGPTEQTLEEVESFIREVGDLQPNPLAIEELKKRIAHVKRKSRNKQIVKRLRAGIGKAVLVVPTSGFEMRWIDLIQIRQAIGKELDHESYNWLEIMRVITG